MKEQSFFKVLNSVMNIKKIITSIFKYLSDVLIHSVEDYKSVWDKGITINLNDWIAITFSVCYSFFVICLWRLPMTIPIGFLPIFLVAFFILQGKLYRKCKSLRLQDGSVYTSVISVWKISLLIFCSYYIYIFVIGTFESSDTRSQWRQVLECNFDDWHPVMHTFSLYLLYKILRFHFLVVLFFVALFSHACGWLFVTLRHFKYHKNWCVIVLVLICLSPVTLTLLRVLWKDTAFGISVLYISVFLVHLWHNGGKELRWWHWTAFGFLLFYASFVRHNGFFFTVPILVFIPFVVKKRKERRRLVLFSVLIFGCLAIYVETRYYLKSCGIIHQWAKVQSFSEAVGIPMCMMSRVMVYHPERMPRDAHNFMLTIFSQNEWKKYYGGDFNSVKFSSLNSYNAFLKVKPKKFISMFVRTTIASPGCSLNALIHTTSLSIDPFWCNDISQYMYVYGKTDNGFFTKIMILMPWGWLFLAPGFIILQLIVLGTYAFLKHGYRVLLMITPFIAYTWGTSLLLSGWDHRYFWGILIGGIPIILLLITSHQIIEE